MVDQDRAGRRALTVFAIVVLLLAGVVVTSPSASAGWCTHSDHTHAHNGHSDYYHFHLHFDEFGSHYHNWHNHTHDDYFTEQC